MKRLMAILVTAFTLFAACPTACLADDMYVGDITKLNVRSGNDIKYNVIATLKSGEKVSVLSFAGGWTKIESMDGKQGWVVSRYLTGEKPANARIEDLQIKKETLQEQLEMAAIENRKLQEENIDLAARLNETSVKLGNAEEAFKALQEDSKEYLTLKEKYDKITKESIGKDTKIRSLEDKVDDQYIAIAIKWSLTGAGILLIGFFLGSRTKRKRTSLL